MTPQRFAALWRTLAPIGRGAGGGYQRRAWSDVDRACREWFAAQAAAREMPVESDGNGNLYAWWDPAEPGGARPAVLTGSHFDSVPDGGGYDGALGIASAFLAIDELRDRGWVPGRPVGVAAFVEEEGGRFGVACLGSRLLTGVLDPARAAGLRDGAGISLAEAIRATGADPAGLGPDPALLRRIGAFVELHVEQGRALAGRPGGPAGRSAPVGVASRIWPHGRWRLEFRGEGNHAGTTAMGDRHDPMLTYAYTVLAANKEARLAGGYATIARTTIEPGATNAIPSRVDAWLDARAPSTMELEKLVAAIASRAADRAGRDGTGFTMSEESCSPAVEFDPALRDRLVSILDGAPVLPTGAGHDAGVLAARLPTAMLFVRNPTGVSHAPAEYATDEDCAAGVEALAAVLADLATGTDPAANSDLATGTDRAGNTDPAADTHRAGNSDPAGNTDPAGNSGLAGG